MFVLYAKERGFCHLFCPKDCGHKVKISSDVNVYSIDNLTKSLKYLRGERVLEPTKNLEGASDTENSTFDVDFNNIKGQEHAKRTLEITTAGGHNILMIVPPGIGKMMLAKAFTTILPQLSEEESLEVTKFYSILGKIPSGGSLIRNRQFRSSHHTCFLCWFNRWRCSLTLWVFQPS